MHVYINHTPYHAILSAERFDLSDYENKARTAELIDCLETYGIGFKTVRGCYKGSIETSFYCVLKDDSDLKTVLGLAADFEQETVLIREPETDLCSLWEPETGEPLETIGEWTETTKTGAELADGYTYDIETGIYYIIK